MENHHKWKADITQATGHTVGYPLIGDGTLAVAKLYEMLPADAGDTSEGRTPADNATVRSVFIIGPDKKVKLSLTYPMTTGRNFDEILRALDSIQLTAKYQVATPANWKQGEDVIITAAVSDEEAEKRFGGFTRVLPYLGPRRSRGRGTRGRRHSEGAAPSGAPGAASGAGLVGDRRGGRGGGKLALRTRRRRLGRGLAAVRAPPAPPARRRRPRAACSGLGG